ncbi:UDP-N-acetylmuramate dehydrogenase [Carboxylicivirga sp. N1Y90]|uniref:UDP-N-acetylmuramate dehydrogenase n=1 Tax=Carboxylicivirga fragile TaxID=3417571 RepID=UPI003D32B248|nr:UDP-N-acetylmuramate dehydrogenase [Marinilabiliaceae bacterium N1Y90]
MPQILKNVNLKPYNTFGLEVHAKELAVCSSLEQLLECIHDLNSNPQKHMVIGGGSNLLFSSDYNGRLIHPLIEGIEILDQNTEEVWIEVGAGFEWDDLVQYCVENNWYGIENLSYIPGKVGASPVQNIGAYGVEVQDCIESVKGIHLETGKPFSYTKEECQFAYRQSIFKSALKNKVVIVSVVYKLSKKEVFNLSYGPVKEEINRIGKPTLQLVRNTITAIRKSKLPEPEVLGNAGSFFKNPVVEQVVFESIASRYDKVPSYLLDNNKVKIPAAWLIEKAGWKGKSLGQAAVHDNQALVIINKGKAQAQEIIELSKHIIMDVEEKFAITLEPEVNII